jgi:transcriptional regulator with XRE-family HTH domain
MQFSFDKEWLQKHADSDQSLEIAAGSLSLDQVPPSRSDMASRPRMVAFGRLINLSRRKRGWTIEDLALTARIDASEALRIEHDLDYIPGPRTVYQLSSAFELPSEQMLQLSGNMLMCNQQLGEQAVKFVARSEAAEKLSRQECQALDEFVKYLSEPA